MAEMGEMGKLGPERGPDFSKVTQQRTGRTWTQAFFSDSQAQCFHHGTILISSAATKFPQQDFLFPDSNLKKNQWKLYFSGAGATIAKTHNARMVQLQNRLGIISLRRQIILGTQSRQGTDRNGWGAPLKHHPFSTRWMWRTTALTFLSSSYNSDLIRQDIPGPQVLHL